MHPVAIIERTAINCSTWQLQSARTRRPAMQVSHKPRTARRQLALGGVGSREVKIFNVDHAILESTFENRTSPIAWVNCQVSRPGGQDPELRTLSSDTTSLQSSTSGRGPARLWGRNTTTTSHAMPQARMDSLDRDDGE